MIYVGTSGWQYGSWRERFYPREVRTADWLPYFSARFRTVEVNNSFYRLPTAETFGRWRERSSDGFVFAVKASRFVTHIKRLRDPAGPIETFWDRARRLGEKLGPVLFQLPPRFGADLGRLRDVLAALPTEMRAAFEFRDDSWRNDEVLSLLDGAGCAWVLADRPGSRVPLLVTGGWSYLRFHQGQQLRPGYRPAKLQRWAERIAALNASEVYVYFNNDPEGAAVRDARRMSELLGGLGLRVAA